MAKKRPNMKKLAASVPWLSLLAGLFVIILLTRMTQRADQKQEGIKGRVTTMDRDLGDYSANAQTEADEVIKAVQADNARPSSAKVWQDQPGRVNGGQGYGGLPDVSCSGRPGVTAASLLPDPKNENPDYRTLEPNKKMASNLLKAGWLRGLDTVGASLRNANLQVRSEPPNPQVQVSPWNRSTIAPDLMRVPLEIGCGRQ